MLRAAVLAGGRSSRMGRDKALLELAGITLLDRAIALLHSCGADQVLVSGRPGHRLNVSDLLPQAGPPGAVLSLLTSLAEQGHLDEQPLLLLPVDMPLLTLAVLQPLLAAAKVGASCHFQQEIFPCIVPASTALLGHLQHLFAQSQRPGGERSMRALFSFLDSQPIPLGDSERRLLANVNTPEEWQAIGGHADQC